MWDIGTENKFAIGIVYVLFNFTGVVANVCLLLYFKYRVRVFTSYHIFLSSYSLACIVMSITCGIQCALGLWNGTIFYGGDEACRAEAYFHISSILAQFFSVTGMCVRNYIETIWPIHYHIKNTQAYVACALIWAVCITVTLSLSTVSPIYLMSNGVYCFFDFSSPAIAYWLVPSLAICLVSMILLYAKIFKEAKKIFRAHAHSVASFDASSEYAARLAIRSFSTVALVLICWSPAAITSVYELSVGQTPQPLVTTVGTLGTLHTLMVPVVYGIFIYMAYINEARIDIKPRTRLSLSSPRRLYQHSPSPNKIINSVHPN